MHSQYTIFKTPGVPAPLGEVLYLARLMTCPLAIDQGKIHCWAKIQNPWKENCESMIGKKGFLHCVRTNKKKGIKNTKKREIFCF